jgi:16S rRNA (adenine1518-N6/adenine1519-N6)-dimethyltransferase
MFPQPKKKFGQHFLHDENVIARILRFVPEGEPIIEIGAGRGALTAHLLGRTRRLVAVEYDRDLIPILRGRFGANENFALVERDALDVDYPSIVAPDQRARVVANLPYNIGTAILLRLIEQRACLSEMVLMLQREVVERITARASEPGKKGNSGGERGYLSVFVEAYCEAENLFDVQPAAFTPPPKVWSSVVRVRPRPRIAVDVTDEALLWQIVSAGFAQRRKTIYNNLRGAPHLAARIGSDDADVVDLLRRAEVEAGRRAETLTLEEWSRITNAV